MKMIHSSSSSSAAPFCLLFFHVISLVWASSEWVDPATPPGARTTTAMSGRLLQLVFSDEFEDSSRTFRDGADTRWTSEDRPATVNAALQYYNSSHVLTENGKLVIRTTRQDANWTEYDPNTGDEHHFSRFYQSGMVSTWNKFCFTSGMIEISFQLPGNPMQGGLWPAFWMLGNLARPNYLDSTEGIWPWSYDTCGTSREAIDTQQAQLISNCKNGKGRGSPEIDIIEAQPGDFILQYENVQYVNSSSRRYSVSRPIISSSLQLAPGVDWRLRPYSPNFPKKGQWYPDLYPMGGPAYAGEGTFENNTRNMSNPRMINSWWYGQTINEDPEIWQDGLSCNWHHDHNFYTQQVVLKTEWQAGKDDGYVRFFNGDALIYEITADMLKAKPGAADAIPQIPYEAMYLIMNTDISPRWGWNGCNPHDSCVKQYPGLCSPEGELICRDCSNPDCLRCPETTGWFAQFCEEIDPLRPAEYKIDYVRVYQDTKDKAHTLGCDPPDYPTKDYIKENWKKFTFNSWIKKEPLKMVEHGGGRCIVDADCGNILPPSDVSGTNSKEGEVDMQEIVNNWRIPLRESYCVSGHCQCPDFEWTGPNCHSPCVGEYAKCQSSAPAIILSMTVLVNVVALIMNFFQ